MCNISVSYFCASTVFFLFCLLKLFVFVVVFVFCSREQKSAQIILFAEKEENERSTWTRGQTVVANDVPRVFDPLMGFGAKVQIHVARQ